MDEVEEQRADASALGPVGPIAPGARVAIVGAGAAGLTAAYLMRERHTVTLFEAAPFAGGHAHTFVVPDGPDAGTALDVGFMVFNDRNYPHMHRLLERLGGMVISPSEMSFGYTSADGAVQYALNWDPAGAFAQRLNLVPGGAAAAQSGLVPMMGDVLRLFRRASRDLEAGALGDASLGDYVRSLGLSEGLLRDYLVPMGAAIWSASPADLPAAPAAFVLGFFRNHGLLSVEAGPQWLYLEGGARTYVDAIARELRGALRLGTGVAHVARGEDGVRLTLADGSTAAFDHVVVATHADQALALLADPSPDEAAWLGAWRYQANEAVLHTDAGVMPENRAVWASWNYCGEADAAGAPSLTYHLNRLQGHRDTAEQYFLTLNARRAIDPARVLRTFRFTHPCYGPAAVASRAALAAANGGRRTYFCGSYFGNGFHEDAIRAGADVAAAFGCPL